MLAYDVKRLHLHSRLQDLTPVLLPGFNISAYPAKVEKMMNVILVHFKWLLTFRQFRGQKPKVYDPNRKSGQNWQYRHFRHSLHWKPRAVALSLYPRKLLPHCQQKYLTISTDLIEGNIAVVTTDSQPRRLGVVVHCFNRITGGKYTCSGNLNHHSLCWRSVCFQKLGKQLLTLVRFRQKIIRNPRPVPKARCCISSLALPPSQAKQVIWPHRWPGSSRTSLHFLVETFQIRTVSSSPMNLTSADFTCLTKNIIPPLASSAPSWLNDKQFTGPVKPENVAYFA